jgi:hypothetical protein
VLESSIVEIAERARNWMEHVADSEGFHPSLCGLCARASALLFEMLKDAGYDPRIAVSLRANHFFVLLDGHVIDITATQFHFTNQEKVHIETNEEREVHYHVDWTFDNVPTLISWQRKANWLDIEIPQVETEL